MKKVYKRKRINEFYVYVLSEMRIGNWLLDLLDLGIWRLLVLLLKEVVVEWKFDERRGIRKCGFR